jgi:hypothetical protein
MNTSNSELIYPYIGISDSLSDTDRQLNGQFKGVLGMIEEGTIF